MKFFILLLIAGLAAAEFHVKSHDDLIKYHDECGHDEHLPTETIAKFKRREYADDTESHCHIKCLAKKLGIFDAEHGIVTDNWVKQVSAANSKTEAEVRPEIVKCAEEIAQYKSDECLWAYKGFVCTKKHGWEFVKRGGPHKKPAHKKH